MSKHLKYMSYILRHKYYVMRECFKIGLYWRGLAHDLSKLLPSEWGPYVNNFYGKAVTESIEFKTAWLHHQHRNPHHWQYWLIKEDNGPLYPLPMPDKYIKEMVADWRSASRANKGFDDTINWYEANKHKMILEEETRHRVEALLKGAN